MMRPRSDPSRAVSAAERGAERGGLGLPGGRDEGRVNRNDLHVRDGRVTRKGVDNIVADWGTAERVRHYCLAFGADDEVKPSPGSRLVVGVREQGESRDLARRSLLRPNECGRVAAIGGCLAVGEELNSDRALTAGGQVPDGAMRAFEPRAVGRQPLEVVPTDRPGVLGPELLRH